MSSTREKASEELIRSNASAQSSSSKGMKDESNMQQTQSTKPIHESEAKRLHDKGESAKGGDPLRTAAHDTKLTSSEHSILSGQHATLTSDTVVSDDTPRQVIAVSASKGPAAFFNLARKFLVTDEMCDLSALEGAIVSAVDAAHLLERSQLATIVRVQTSYVTVEPKRKKQVIQMQTSQEENLKPVPEAPASTAVPKELTTVQRVPPSQSSEVPDQAKNPPQQNISQPAQRSAGGRELRRARIVITVKRTENYKQWLLENPLQAMIAGSSSEEIDEGSEPSSSAKSERPAEETPERKNKKARPSKKKKSGPSEEALQLSTKLKEFSRDKNLDAALKEYWDSSNDSIRDGHHACIIVDCSARCGKISVGEEIIERLTTSGNHVNVETKTALIKGYVHSGDIGKAEAVFLSMCESKGKSDLPNIRTLNTLLRGCLWSSASVGKNKVVTGGVVTSEKIWALYKGLVERNAVSSPDISSFEYSITLLCQALKAAEGEQRIEELKAEFGASKGAAEDIDQSVSESLSLSYLALARAYAILSNNAKAADSCKKAVDFAKLSKKSLKTGTSSEDQYRKRGKNISDTRLESNALYREHRLSEVESEAKTIKDIVAEKKGEDSSSRELARRLLLRLLVFSGGGTTDLELSSKEAKSEDECSVQHRLVHAAYFSYGLDVPLKSLGVEFGNEVQFLRKRDCNRILGSVGLQGGIVNDNGVVDFRRVFNAGMGKAKGKKRKKQRNLEIELGSGFGDWAAKQALAFPEKDFLAVELRSDRVGQTFARTSILSSMSPVENLCSVGAESGSFLIDHVAKESVSTIYINHPEPPTQIFGAESTNIEAIMSGSDEPAHMLCSRTLIAAANCLKNSSDGKIVIVTDNQWYGRLICATFVRIARQSPDFLHPVNLSKHNYREIESFPVNVNKQDPVVLYEGQPGEAIGHAKSGETDKGSSYFDRLWRSGAGSHAEKRSRFVIVMSREQEKDR